MADLFAKVSCTYCQEDINGVRVQCCVCTDFDMCLQCFASGAEIGPHKNDHAYKFYDQCAVSIFGGKGAWTGREELMLLDAVEFYGFGNWERVAQDVETRTAEEVKEEYISRYLEGNIGKATWAALENHKPILYDHVPEDNGPLSPSVTARLPPLEITPEEARLLGYKPYRDDYEREYNMEAESLVSKLQLDPAEDSELEIALKLSIVDIYTRKLRERARRKRIVRDYQLVSKYFSTLRKDPPKRPLTKEQRELRDKSRVFAQFLTSGEHDRLIASMERERELRHRLNELLRYRNLGLTTQEEIIHYEQHAAFQRQQQMRQSKSGSSGYLTSTQECPTENGNGEIESSSTEKKSTWHREDVPENNNTSLSQRPSAATSAVDPPISTQPPETLLSKSEIQFCTDLEIQPVHYNTLKSLIIQESLVAPKKHVSEETKEFGIKEAVTQYLGFSGWLPG
ncbi:transcriptional adapter 2B [Aethina tumida]|uniref:transcriptional adapter 2B n=1 Tax=Aethina tumida TaxID=116153 RepID=UPI00096AF6B5|nr:transcriptional adapter 2B [Aethina tumida]